MRNGKKISFDVTPRRSVDGRYKIGVYVKDSAAGIGTVTFIDPATGAFVLVCGNLVERLLYFANYINHVMAMKKALPYYLPGKRVENIHFTIPILMAVLIHIGGFY